MFFDLQQQWYLCIHAAMYKFLDTQFCLQWPNKIIILCWGTHLFQCGNIDIPRRNPSLAYFDFSSASVCHFSFAQMHL